MYVYAPVRIMFTLTLVSGVAGCQTIGPGSVQRDRLDYAAAIADSFSSIAETGTVPLVPIITIPAN
jgi:hypothetical protein